MKTFWQILAAVLLVGAGYLWGRQSADVVERVTIRVDTLFYERPKPFRSSFREMVAVRIPRMIVAPTDTVRQLVYVTVPESNGDSVSLNVPIVEREYRDSSYRAQVSGPQVGEYGPALDWIETYDRTTTHEVQRLRRSRFAVTAGVGMAYTSKGFQPYVGAGVGVVLWQW